MKTRIGKAPGAPQFEALARAAFARIPPPFAEHLEGITIEIAEFADEETLEALGIEDPFELTGLYHGVPMGEESIWSAGQLPPHITLYRQPLLAEWCEAHVTLEDLVGHVIIHEVGHHFGLSDADMHTLEDALD